MADENTPIDLEAQAAELVAEVDSWKTNESVGGAAMQGMFSAFSDLTGLVVDLVKGKKESMSDDDDDDPEGEGEGEGEGEREGGGFEDMNFSTGAGIDDEYFDVGPFVEELDGKVNAIGKQLQQSHRENRALRGDVKALLKANTELQGTILRLAAAQAGGQIALAKAVTGFQGAIEAIPQPSAFQPAPARRPAVTGGGMPVPAGGGAGFLGGSERTEKQMLAKGLATNIIDDSDNRRFYTTRKFSEDEAEHAAIVQKLAAAYNDAA